MYWVLAARLDANPPLESMALRLMIAAQDMTNSDQHAASLAEPL
jgi:hypothetical protein